MALLLDTPHVHDPGHGQADIIYSHVMVVEFTVRPVAKALVMRLQYGNVTDGEWVPSSEQPHVVRIQNTPAVISSGQHPETKVWVEEVVTEADNAYDSAKTSLQGEYDALGAYMYSWLIAHGHYTGTIV